MLDYNHLEALAAVIQEGGFERAAGILHITQSAVSQRLKLLEDQVGQLLLIRSSPPRPTEMGRQFLRHFRQVAQLEGDLHIRLNPADDSGCSVFAIGVDRDSLETWFLEALKPLLRKEQILLDLYVADQERTHRLLNDGDVVGCVSDRSNAMQGCVVRYLGHMDYRLLATPAFCSRWFPSGITKDSMKRAPLMTFSRVDKVQGEFLKTVLGEKLPPMPSHYMPSTMQYLNIICSGVAYGTLPDLQTEALLRSGRLVDLAPGKVAQVPLYWHRWSINSRKLKLFSDALEKGAAKHLPQ